jgi:hypothetical protein
MWGEQLSLATAAHLNYFRGKSLYFSCESVPTRNGSPSPPFFLNPPRMPGRPSLLLGHRDGSPPLRPGIDSTPGPISSSIGLCGRDRDRRRMIPQPRASGAGPSPCCVGRFDREAVGVGRCQTDRRPHPTRLRPDGLTRATLPNPTRVYPSWAFNCRSRINPTSDGEG